MLPIQAQLMSVLGFPAERVLIAPLEVFNDYYPQGDQFVAIWPRDEHPDIPNYNGAGRINMEATVVIDVTLRTRYAVDETTSRLAWLTDTGLGHLIARAGIWNALVAFQPTDNGDLTGNSGNWLCVQPIGPLVGRTPNAGAKVKPPPPPGWGSSTVSFELKYQMLLNQAQQ